MVGIKVQVQVQVQVLVLGVLQGGHRHLICKFS